MNTTRPFHPGKSLFRVLLVVASLVGMLLQMATPVRAASHAASALNSSPNGTAQSNPSLGVTSSDAQGITLELSTPDFTIEQTQVDGQACQIIHIEGYGAGEEAGQPELPVRGAMLGIPVHSNPTLVVEEAKAVALEEKFRLCPMEQPTMDQKLPGSLPIDGLSAGAAQPAWDVKAYAVAQFLPQAAAELASIAFLRSQRVAEVKFYPFQYNPASGELRYFQHITARLDFNEAQPAPQSVSQPASRGAAQSAFETMLQNTLLNYQQAAAWRSEPRSQMDQRSDSVNSNQPAYKILVDQDGLYQVTYEALAAAAGEDLQPGQAVNTFRLFSSGDFTRGNEIAIQVLDGGDGSFGPGDAILFYGQKVDTQFTGMNVYYLTWGGAEGMRMNAVDSNPTGGDDTPSFLNHVHLEQNVYYLSFYPSGNSRDVWYWDYIQKSGSHTYTTMLASIANDAAYTVKVSGLLRSYNATPQHHTRIYLNGHLIDDKTWANGATYFFEIEAPQSYLVEGTNSITVEALMDNGITDGIVLINWFEIDYWATFAAENDQASFSTGGSEPMSVQISDFSTDQLDVYDVTDPTNVARLVNYSTVPDGQDYRLDFEQENPGEHEYITQAQTNRLNPQGIVRDHISDLHSTSNAADYIIITPADFLSAAQTLADWRTAQGFRSLVVDAADIYDEFSGGLMSPQAIHDFLAYAYANWQPPAPLYIVLFGDGHYDPRNYLGASGPVFIPPYLEFVDHWLGETASDNRFVTVNGNDNLPDMFIGRIPVNSLAQASATVAKILAYEQNPPSTAWNSNVLFVADNSDSAGNFPSYADMIANNYLPADYNAEKVYYGVTHTTVSAARTAILNEINNDGALIVNYVGHGYSQGWASENLFTNSSIASLANAGKLPFVVSMSCLVGSFHSPDLNGYDMTALAEKLVVTANSGAIASFASTGMGLASGQDYLNRGLFQAIFSENRIRLGAATTQAKLFLYAITGSYQDLIDTYVLLGDPATRLNVLDDPTQVDLSHLVAVPGPARIEISWTTEMEINNLGFNIYRAESPDGARLRINPTLIPTKVLDGGHGADYTFKDNIVVPGAIYYYWIESVGTGGNILSDMVSTMVNWPTYLPLLRQ
jgi:hypothetical protein